MNQSEYIQSIIFWFTESHVKLSWRFPLVWRKKTQDPDDMMTLVSDWSRREEDVAYVAVLISVPQLFLRVKSSQQNVLSSLITNP